MNFVIVFIIKDSKSGCFLVGLELLTSVLLHFVHFCTNSLSFFSPLRQFLPFRSLGVELKKDGGALGELFTNVWKEISLSQQSTMFKSKCKN